MTCWTWKAAHEETGKRTGKDAARGKLTYPGLLGVAESRAKAQKLQQRKRKIWSAPPSEKLLSR